MYRVYLADDNDLFRESLIKTISWEKIDCTLIGDARDGDTAGREILELKPDIVLMDIRMPGMSGLEIAALLKTNGFRGRVIIITGYNDFSYAQKGIRIGVFDFLLKPIDESELENVIVRACRDIEQEREDKKRQALFEDEISKEAAGEVTQGQNLDLLLQKGLNGDPESLENMESIVSSQMCFTLYELLRVSPDNPQGMGGRSMEAWTMSVRELFEKLPDGVSACFAIHEKALYVLVYFRMFDAARDYDIETVRLATMAYQKSVENQNDVCISISRCHDKFKDLREAVREAQFSFDSRFFIENRHVIHYNSLKSNSMANLYPIMQKVEEFYGILREHPSEIEKSLEDIEVMFHAGGCFDLAVLRNILANMAIMINMILAEHVDEEDSRSVNAGNIIQEMNAASSIDEAFRILRRYAVKVVVQAQNESEESNRAVTERILDYLDHHYQERLSLQDVCDYVGFSRGYVCRILKNDTGETFVSLLNKIRIEKAKEMLATHQYKVYEVAEATGFSNYAYFYQAYRKYTGLSPKNT